MNTASRWMESGATTRPALGRNPTSSGRKTACAKSSSRNGLGRVQAEFRQRLFALQERRVRVVKSAEGRVRREVAQVFLVEFAQSAGERSDFAGDLGRVSIGLVFVASRPEVRQGR